MSDERDDKAAQRDPGPGDTRSYHPNILPKRQLPKHVVERCGAIIAERIFGRSRAAWMKREKKDEGEEAVT